MPTNTTQNDPSSSGTLASEAPMTPTKGGKAKSTRSPRRSAGAASKRSPATRRSAASSAEILFEDLPNPYHAPQPPYIWIDHPQERTRLSAPDYVIRLGVGGAEHVEISIDESVWQNCRFTSGYWWYDWSGIQPGRHTLTARMRTSNGRWFRTPPRSCERRP